MPAVKEATRTLVSRVAEQPLGLRTKAGEPSGGATMNRSCTHYESTALEP